MTGQTIRVALLTTSFPLREGMTSGVFVQRLVKHLPTFVQTIVVTPCDVLPAKCSDDYQLRCFRYAPWKWQRLAHQPGGIPVALRQSKLMWMLLPVFLTAMFAACFRVAKNVDVIHANWSINGAVAGFVGFILRKPIVTTLRGEDVARAKSSKLFRFLLSMCLRSNNRVVAVSKSIHGHLVSEFPKYKHKVIFLPNGVHESLLRRPVKRSEENTHAPFKLLTVGSLISRKGVSTIIEALQYVYAPRRFKLVVVGDGPERNALQELVAEKSLNDLVEFVGQVPPEQVVEYLCDADAFILASYSEGRPNVVLESFAAGVPVVASDIEGVKELINDGENGMRFQPGAAKELAAKLEKLQKSSVLQKQFSSLGREFILKNHLLWKSVGQEYAQLYREVASL